MREPSIHITRAKLIILFEEYDKRHGLGINIDHLVNYLLSTGKVYQIKRRIPLVNTKKQQKQVIQGTMSTQEATSLMAKTIRFIRLKDNKYKAPPLIKEGSNDWKNVREIAELATRFCDAYGFTISKGFTRYINIYMLIKTKSFNLTIFNARHEYICETYEAQVRIEDNEYKDECDRAHEYYQKEIFEKTGQQLDYRKQPVKYECFIDGMIQADEMNITPEDYIEAGFDQLAWKSGIPSIKGFGTDMYKERVIVWMAENNYKTADNTDAEDSYRAAMKRISEADEDSD